MVMGCWVFLVMYFMLLGELVGVGMVMMELVKEGMYLEIGFFSMNWFFL